MAEQFLTSISKPAAQEAGVYDSQSGRTRTFRNVLGDWQDRIEVAMSSRPTVARMPWFSGLNAWTSLSLDVIAGLLAMPFMGPTERLRTLTTSRGEQLLLKAYPLRDLLTGVFQLPVPQEWRRAEQSIALLKNAKVRLVNEQEVERYLVNHPGLEEVTLQAAEAVKTEFPDAEEISLDLYRDPESVDQYLILYVDLATPQQQDYERLQRAKDRYLRALESLRSGWMAVDIRATRHPGT